MIPQNPVHAFLAGSLSTAVLMVTGYFVGKRIVASVVARRASASQSDQESEAQAKAA